MADNLGLVAINDPFLLETDPVADGAPLALTLAPAAAPEPAGWASCLAGLGLVTLVAGRRRTRRR
jgi:hypothetical protein